MEVQALLISRRHVDPAARQDLATLAAEAEEALETLRQIMHVCRLFGARPLHEIDADRLVSLLEPVLDFVEEADGQIANEKQTS